MESRTCFLPAPLSSDAAPPGLAAALLGRHCVPWRPGVGSHVTSRPRVDLRLRCSSEPTPPAATSDTDDGGDQPSSTLGKEAAEKLRQEYVYGPHGPYSHRAPIKGRPVKMNFASPVVSCTFTTTETDEEQEASQQALMCYKYEMAVRKWRRQHRKQQRQLREVNSKSTSANREPATAPTTPPISYYFAFVSRSPPPPASAKVWEAWTLVGQVAVEDEAPAADGAPAAAPKEDGTPASAPATSGQEPPVGRDGGESFPGARQWGSTRAREGSPVKREQGLAKWEESPVKREQGLVKWELPARMPGRAMTGVVDCVGWTRPDLLYLKRPCFELRFEPQEPFMQAVAARLLPSHPPVDPRGSSAGTQSRASLGGGTGKAPPSLHALICAELGLSYNNKRIPCSDEIAGAFEEADAGTQSAVLGLIFGVALGSEANRGFLRDKEASLLGELSPHRRFSGLDQTAGDADGKDKSSEKRPNNPGTKKVPEGFVLDENLRHGAASSVSGGQEDRWMEGEGSEASPPGNADAARFLGGRAEDVSEVGAKTSAMEALEEWPLEGFFEEDDVLSQEDGGELDGKRSGRGKQRLKLSEKQVNKGASGKVTWKTAVCPYTYSRLVFEVCALADVAMYQRGMLS